MSERYPTRSNSEALDQLKRGWTRLPEVLKQMGFTDLRPGQKPVVCNIMAGKDTLCILPTSAGKSACFVLPTLALEWKTIVFSPLTALMRDQVQSLNRNRIAAMAISSIQSDGENDFALQQWAAGNLSFLYVAPERIHNKGFKNAMEMRAPDMVVVDEAHCLSQWGENFRSSYCSVGDFIAEKKPKVVAAFTATCPAPVEEDVRRVLGLQQAERLLHYPRRMNLNLKSMDLIHVSDICRTLEENKGPAIVYCSTVARTEELTGTLGSLMNEEVVMFHGQLNDSDKRNNMDLFMSDRVRVVVATNAFGMGVDKGNVRTVIHRDIPGSVEALSQEIGRAGRDGQDSLCLSYFSQDSLQTQEFFLTANYPSAVSIRKVFNALRTASDQNGYVEMTISQIGVKAGIYKLQVGTIMEILKAHRVVERIADKQRIFKIRRLSETAKDAKFELWWGVVESIGVRVASGFYEVDMPSFVQQLGVTEQTVRNWTSKWQTLEWIRYVPPFAGAPCRLIGPVSLIDFDRLDHKAVMARNKLNSVMDYMNTPDAHKHDFLEKYFELNQEPMVVPEIIR
jgi:ATP-dependent DNA helicase RecQ